MNIWIQIHPEALGDFNLKATAGLPPEKQKAPGRQSKGNSMCILMTNLNRYLDTHDMLKY